MTQSSPDHLAALHVVQQKLGHCVLRLQAYELGLKEILQKCDIVVTAKGVKTDPRLPVSTLGRLVEQLFGSLLTTEAASEPANAGEAGQRIRVRTRIPLPKDEFVRLESELKAFVDLRNDLIHHFRECHDLGSHEGCQSAEADLNTTSARIERHIADLRNWAEVLQSTQQAVLGSDVFQEYVKTGRFPDQSPRSGH